MKKNRFFIGSLALVGVLSCFFLVFKFCLSKKTYFGHYTVQFSNSNTPVIDVEIEGQYYPLVFDSGSCFQISLLSNTLKGLDLEPYGTYTWRDVKGIEYENSRYLLKKFKLKPFTFSHVTVVDIPNYKSVLIWKGKDKSDCVNPVGDFGYKLINKCNWLLDLHNSIIIASNSRKKLKKSGYDLTKFIAIPFIRKSSGVHFDVQTDFGPVCLWLDTGCTINLIKPSRFPEVNEASDKIRFGHPVFSSTSFMMGGQQMGPIEMLFFDMGDEEPLSEFDGILGVDFLKKYAIYLDFEKNIAYLREN